MMESDADLPKSSVEVRAILDERATKARANARKNDFAAMTCYLVAIFGSLAATLAVALGNVPKLALAAITAIPGTALLLNSVLCFDKKCQWHRRRKMTYDALDMRLRFEGATASDVSRELRDFEQKADADYPRFSGPISLKSTEV